MSSDRCDERQDPTKGRDPATGRFLPGNHANDSGRPKTAHLSRALRKKLAEVDPRSKEGKTFAEQIADALVERALKGDVRAIAEVADRCEGKARQTVEVGSLQTKFERMTPEELRRYAESGELPVWFNDVVLPPGPAQSLPPVKPGSDSEVVDAEFVESTEGEQDHV